MLTKKLRDVFNPENFPGYFFSIALSKDEKESIQNVINCDYFMSAENRASRVYGSSLTFAGSVSDLILHSMEALNHYSESAEPTPEKFEVASKKHDVFLDMLDAFVEICDDNSDVLAVRYCPPLLKNVEQTPDYFVLSIVGDTLIGMSTRIGFASITEEVANTYTTTSNFAQYLKAPNGLPTLYLTNENMKVAGFHVHPVETKALMDVDTYKHEGLLVLASMRNMDNYNLDEEFKVPYNTGHGKLLYCSVIENDNTPFAIATLVLFDSTTGEKVEIGFAMLDALYNSIPKEILEKKLEYPMLLENDEYIEALVMAHVIRNNKNFEYFLSGGSISRSLLKKSNRFINSLLPRVPSSTSIN